MRNYDLAERVIAAATGEPYGDGEIVTNVGVGYAEPGYPSDARWALGNWNDKRLTKCVPGIVNGRPTQYARISAGIDTTPSRLANALEWIGGIELEWCDEWIDCSECYRIVRTEADSYSWTPSYLWANEGEIVCHKCAQNDPEVFIVDYVNNSDKAITWTDSTTLESLGFTQWNEDTSYENGWYPGQTDDPKAILESIHDQDDTLDVVFLIDSVGQFDCRFSAYVRAEKAENYEAGDE